VEDDLSDLAPLELGDIASPGVEQVSLVGAEPGDDYALHDESNQAVASGVVDDYGSLVFRLLDADQDNRLVLGASISEPLDVLARDEHPDPAFFAEQRIEVNRENNTGFDYIETRDGTTLGAYIVLPGPIEEGPYPTVIEYSGYSPSNPGQGRRLPDAVQRTRLRLRWGERPWHRLQRGFVPLLRVNAIHRRLRRHRSGRCAAVGAGQRGGHGRHLVPRRHAQHRLRLELDPGSRRLCPPIDHTRRHTHR
jgi:hypothetical protein